MKLPFGKRKTAHNDEEYGHGHEHGHEGADAQLGKPATAKGRTLLLLSMLLGLLSLACLIVGTALLQHRIRNRLTSGLPYSESLQSAHYTPYGDSHRRQWQLLWWIIAGSAFIWLLTFVLALRAVRIHQWHAALVGFHIYFLVLCTYAIDSFLWLDHHNVAQTFFKHSYLRVVLAGLFGLAVAHALAVLALGLIPSARHLDSRNAAHVASSRHESHTKERVVEMPMTQRSTHAAPVTTHHTPQFSETTGEHPVRVHQGGVYPHQNQ